MKTLLKGGTVVSAAGSRVADVLVDGEKIAAVGYGGWTPKTRSASAAPLSMTALLPAL